MLKKILKDDIQDGATIIIGILEALGMRGDFKNEELVKCATLCGVALFNEENSRFRNKSKGDGGY